MAVFGSCVSTILLGLPSSTCIGVQLNSVKSSKFRSSMIFFPTSSLGHVRSWILHKFYIIWKFKKIIIRKVGVCEWGQEKLLWGWKIEMSIGWPSSISPRELWHSNPTLIHHEPHGRPTFKKICSHTFLIRIPKKLQ